MLACPNCRRGLRRAVTPFGVVCHCPECGGRMIGLATLRRDAVDDAFRSRLWQESRRAGTGTRVCPHCRQFMRRVELASTGARVELDVCRHCQCVWFDPAEYDALPHAPADPPAAAGRRELPADARAREAAALMDLRMVRERQAVTDTGPAAPDEPWKWVVGLLGVPVEMSQPPLSGRPLVTWSLAAALVGTFLLTLAGVVSVDQLAFVPREWHRLGGATVLTSFFLHAGWFHLLGNLYFFLVFGDNVEDRLGTRRYLLLILAGHAAGTILHGAFDPRPDVPVVGASSGIFAVVAFYALAFPHSRLGLLFFYVFWVRIPAWVMLVFFGGLQFLGSVLQLSGEGSTSSLGHLGGMAVGIAAGLLWRAGRDRRLLASAGQGYSRSERREPE